jgi:hypothetical protein
MMLLGYSVARKRKCMELENLLHYLAKVEDDENLKLCLKVEGINFLVCPLSPLEVTQSNAGATLLKYYKNQHKNNNWKLFSMIKETELRIILKMQESVSMQFFELFTIVPDREVCFGRLNL